VQPLRSAPFGVLALTHAKRLPKCDWMADAAEVIECMKTETCEIATSTDLPEPTSAVRHACHPVVMASLACDSISCWLTVPMVSILFRLSRSFFEPAGFQSPNHSLLQKAMTASR
jgi:hypothetical protein